MTLFVLFLERLKVSLVGPSIGIILLEMLHELLGVVTPISWRNIAHR